MAKVTCISTQHIGIDDLRCRGVWGHDSPPSRKSFSNYMLRDRFEAIFEPKCCISVILGEQDFGSYYMSMRTEVASDCRLHVT